MSDKNKSNVSALSTSTGKSPVAAGLADVARTRETRRRVRTLGLLATITTIAACLSTWVALGSPLPVVDPFLLIIIVFFGLMIAMVAGQQLFTGRSPHVTFMPEQIKTRFDHVVGIDGVKEEVVRSLDLFLAHKEFQGTMGGTPRRGILFEGSPGTGKTLMAKAMAAEAGVPFLFVSGTSFLSMWQGGSAKKIRSYFKALRKVARAEGGVIGFIEEIDAIALRRSGMAMTQHQDTNHSSIMCCGGLSGLPSMEVNNAGLVTNQMSGGADAGAIVNELLVQMQSFDNPTGGDKIKSFFIDKINLFLPTGKRLKRPDTEPVNILLIAATNRADNLDPALLRPGRFDRRLTFELPTKAGRREIIDFYLGRKAHGEELEGDEKRDALAAVTQGYSPVMIENLLDEALINSVRRGVTQMSWADVEHARMAIEVGIGQPVEYTKHEEKLIASHEAGHATVAWLMAPQRRLEILTIIKRKDALGMLAHGDKEDVFTRSRSEMLALIQIAMGGQVAEEMLFGDVSTGPAGDLSYATNVAVQMVGSAGMVNSLVSFGNQDLHTKVLGDTAGRQAVESILTEAKASVRTLLGANLPHVEALRDALLERKELIGHEIEDVLLTAGERPEVTPLRLAETV